jgi:DNA-binding beta-propeller fold protein YncE
LKKEVAFPALLLLLLSSLRLLVATDPKSRQTPLPTSKILTSPSPGRIGGVNSFPATIALSPDGRYAAVLNDGYGTQQTLGRQSISILDLETNVIRDFPDDRLSENAHQTYFLGLAFSSDGSHVYASIASITDPTGKHRHDTGNGIAVYSFRQGKLTPERFIKIAPQTLARGKKVAQALRTTPPGTAIPYPAGISVLAGQGGHLLVANNLSDNVVLLDPADGRILKQFDLSTHEMIASSFPYNLVATRDGRRAWVSLWNASRVAELDLEQATVLRSIPLLEPKDPFAPGSHPTALLLSPDEKLLYVALSNADRVAVISTETGALSGLLNTALRDQKYAGTYPNALAQTADGRHLFVADASINAVAVFDASPGISNAPTAMGASAPGFIPTDWYPSALAVHNDELLIATAKGQSTGPNNFPGHTPGDGRHGERAYIVTLLYGSIARLKFAEIENNLDEFTGQVERDNLFRSAPGKIDFRSGSNPIKHVIYVLKENRTYDQVFGDLKVGNGDRSLTLYGADVTPNEHALARQFGVLDNFYDSGEVSGDGHIWSNAAITSDYNEKTWQIAYRGKERIYDFGGTVNEEYPLELGQADVDDPGTGYLWDNLSRNGISFRVYGEFVGAEWCKPERVASPTEGTPSTLTARCPHDQVQKGEPLPANLGQPHGSPSPWPWPVPMFSRTRPTKAVLRDHYDPNFPDFNTDYPDQLRADEFLNEFSEFVRARKEGSGNELPAFVLLYLPDDHTHGTSSGHPRPAASVADNDLALGRVVEAVSHSPYWDDTAIFVIEDDAQDGADHVDAHRSIALEISKYSPGSLVHPFLDSRFYTTVNMIHTMEELLGLPPMNQNDAYAPVMGVLFSGPGNQPPYSADWRNRDNGFIYQVNPPKGQGAKQSAKMDFSRPDAAKAAVLNRILWRDRKGSVPIPPPRHAVLPASRRGADDD